MDENDQKFQAYTDAAHTASQAVSKTKQVVMLYEGAISYAQQAKEAIEKGDVQGRFNALTKACDILTGLQASLDFEKGGEVAKILYDYYAGVDMRLMSLHQEQNMVILEATIKHLKMMKEAWEEVEQEQGDVEPTDNLESKIDAPPVSKPAEDSSNVTVEA